LIAAGNQGDRGNKLTRLAPADAKARLFSGTSGFHPGKRCAVPPDGLTESAMLRVRWGDAVIDITPARRNGGESRNSDLLFTD